jgi:hypothetical protein
MSRRGRYLRQEAFEISFVLLVSLQQCGRLVEQLLQSSADSLYLRMYSYRHVFATTQWMKNRTDLLMLGDESSLLGTQLGDL